MTGSPLIFILTSILCSSLAHVSLKMGAPRFELHGGLAEIAWRTAGNGWLIAGMGLHAVALLVWVLALKKAELSFVYPFIGLGFVLVSLLSWLIFHETIGPARIAGMLLITAGVILISATG